MRILITGATGTAGSETLNVALDDPEIAAVTTLTRNAISNQHAKLISIQHSNFLDYSQLFEVFQKQDACVWCLGISQTQVSKEEYEIITFQYAIAAARALRQANPSIAFVFLSGAGADSTEQSRTLFARVKGKTENALQQLGLARLVIARPAGIKPASRLNRNASTMNKIVAPLFPLLEAIAPNMVISATDLAKAVLHVAKYGSAKTILENSDLKQIAIQYSK